jgi:hypothetical protein
MADDRCRKPMSVLERFGFPHRTILRNRFGNVTMPAVGKAGDTVDFLFRAKRDKAAAERYFEKAIAGNGAPETVTIDKSGANLVGLSAINADRELPIKI